MLPGIYEVGREDGKQKPFLVKVYASTDQYGNKTMRAYSNRPEEAALALRAMNESGWWWRYVPVPQNLPVSLATGTELPAWDIPLPPAPKE